MSDCMDVRSSRIGSVKDNLSRRMEGRKTREIGEFIRIYKNLNFNFKKKFLVFDFRFCHVPYANGLSLV